MDPLLAKNPRIDTTNKRHVLVKCKGKTFELVINRSYPSGCRGYTIRTMQGIRVGYINGEAYHDGTYSWEVSYPMVACGQAKSVPKAFKKICKHYAKGLA